MKKEKSVRRAEFRAALKAQLKSFIAPAVILAVIAAGVLFVAFWKEEEEPEEIIKVDAYEGPEDEIILENESLKFVMDPLTTQFSVMDKSSGRIWTSNPEGADDDPIALPAEKAKLKSTLLLTYSTVNGVDTVYDSYTYSVKNGIYNIETAQDSVKVSYSVGDMGKEYVVPPVITEADMDVLLSKMGSSDASSVKSYYKKYDINNLGKKDDKDALLTRYPILEQEIIYVLRDGTKDNLKKKFETFFEEAGYTYEEYMEDKELDLSESTSDKPVFNVSILYRLKGDELSVEIPMEEIEYREEYPLLTLNVLPWFGAGGTDETGYLLVPEGGGALIRFNNGKKAQDSYFANVYGWDMAQGRKALVHETKTNYGVFGISKGDASFLCILESGVPYAQISADISGRNHSYNYVCAGYSILHREQYDVADKYNGKMFVYEEAPAGESLIQIYRFLDSGSYVDMAREYQTYLSSVLGDGFREREETGVPIALEIVGAADKVEQVLGLPVSRPLKLTSFEEAEEMLRILTGEGVSNLSVKLSGWANGGIHQTVLNSVKPVSRLGGKKSLLSLTSFAQDNQIRIYLDGIAGYAYNSGITDGFLVFRDAARYVSKEKVLLRPFSTIWYGPVLTEDEYYLLSPQTAVHMMRQLTDAAGEYGAYGVSFRDVGTDLSADYNEDRKYTRQEAMKLQTAELLRIRESGLGLMVNGGNDYVLPYADFVTGMDLGGSHYSILDAEVPFYQIAVHGYLNYAGSPLNLTGDWEEELLRSAEYGAGLSFVFMQEEASVLQNTYYTNYYGADFCAWKDRMLSVYRRYEEELGHTAGQRIADHRLLGENAAVTVYEDGTRVYVNYNREEYTADDGEVIPARDYKVIR